MVDELLHPFADLLFIVIYTLMSRAVGPRIHEENKTHSPDGMEGYRTLRLAQRSLVAAHLGGPAAPLDNSKGNKSAPGI